MHTLCCIAPLPREGGGGGTGEESSIDHSPPLPLLPSSQSKASHLSPSPSLPSRSIDPRIPMATDSSSGGSTAAASATTTTASKASLRSSSTDSFPLRRSPSHVSSNGKLKDLMEVKEPRAIHTLDASHRAPLPPSHVHDNKEHRRDPSSTGGAPTVGSNTAGVLYKWVNFGKGWRPRWFILQDGVLSYYKLHGHGKIIVREGQKGFRVVGDESLRYMKKCRNSSSDDSRPKTSGELHLKISSIRKSKSDDKKLYIFTGTKTLHLRAESREDRGMWLDSLQAAKDLFPKISVADGMILPFEEITVSTTKLKARLSEAGVSRKLVEECEEIMLAEFMELREHLKSLKQNHITLIDRLRLLEAEKVELENTVVDESQKHGQSDYSRELQAKDCEGSASESDEDIEKHDGADGESEEEDDVFFDTKEFLAYRRPNNNLGDSFASTSESEDASPKAKKVSVDPEMDLIGFNYPYVKRRKRLPEPKEVEKRASLWSLIKGSIGTDLTRVCLPVCFNEPISSLQKCFEDLEYSYLLDRAYEWGKRGNQLMRLLHVAAFAVSGYSSTEGRICKPFNPLLGETYEADFPDKGLRFFSEKVSHHPMIVACYCEGRGWKFYGDSTVKSKFWGQSIQLDPVGILTLEFDDGEIFQWSKVTTSIYNLILGKLYCDHYGTMRIQGNKGLTCKLKFKEQSIIDRNPHQVQGFVQDKGGQKLASLIGKWDESMYFINGDLAAKPKGYDPMGDAVLLWERNVASPFATRYNLTSFALTLNELTPGLKEKLPPTDSRLRPDQRHLENGEYEAAFKEKLRLEEKQRMARKLQETGWQPRWFHKAKGEDTYKYVGGYWEARNEGNWSCCPDIFGPGLPEIAQEKQ